MEVKYYQVREILNPEKNGIVVRAQQGRLECVTGGEDLLGEYGCIFKNQRFDVGEDYFYNEISEEQAKRREEEADSWRMTQLYFGTDEISQIIAGAEVAQQIVERNL
jgi:hypothetical protein